MIKDIELGKSYKAQLDIVNHSNFLLEEKLKIKDKIISSYEEKDVNYKSIVENKDKVILETDKIIKGLETDKRNLKLRLFRSNLSTFVLVPLAIGTTYLILK